MISVTIQSTACEHVGLSVHLKGKIEARVVLLSKSDPHSTGLYVCHGSKFRRFLLKTELVMLTRLESVSIEFGLSTGVVDQQRSLQQQVSDNLGGHKEPPGNI